MKIPSFALVVSVCTGHFSFDCNHVCQICASGVMPPFPDWRNTLASDRDGRNSQRTHPFDPWSNVIAQHFKSELDQMAIMPEQRQTTRSSIRRSKLTI
jgi:hypothetical protein